MLRYLADEDFDNRILRAFRRREPDLDWIRVQDVGLSGCEDESVLQFAAENQRVVLTRDVTTMTAAAYSRVERIEPMPGLIVVPHRMAIGRAVDELIFLAKESASDEWEGQVIWLPL
ncbi:MAG: DUF5615 family PIN-like protein [Pirellulales bacterium]